MTETTRYTEGSGSSEIKRTPLWLRAYTFLGLLLFTGALQRVVGGGNSLEGSVSGTVLQQSNSSIAILAMLVYASAGALLVIRHRNVMIEKSMYPLLILNGWAILTALWSSDPSRSLLRSAGLSGCSLFAIYMLNTLPRGEILRQFVNVAVFLVWTTAVLAFLVPSYSFHNSNEFFSIHSGLLKGTFEHKNTLAKVLSYLIVVIVGVGPIYIRNRLFLIITVSMAVYLMALTGSAKTFATVPLGLGAGAVLVFVNSPTTRVWMLGMAAILWFGIEALGLMDQLFSFLLSSLDRDPTLSARTLIWSSAIATATEMHPFLGGGYEVAWQDGIGRAVQSAIGIDPSHAHNGYIMAYIELGLIGSIIVFYALWTIAWRLITTVPGESKRLYFFIGAWFALFIGNNFSGSYLTQPGDIYWLQIVLTPVLLGWVTHGDNIRRNTPSMYSGEKFKDA
tara:strand:+ start:1726 stop:3075 length:1350 start_codon:yes stop_codon:yes gene_type:complete